MLRDINIYSHENFPRFIFLKDSPKEGIASGEILTGLKVASPEALGPLLASLNRDIVRGEAKKTARDIFERVAGLHCEAVRGDEKKIKHAIEAFKVCVQQGIMTVDQCCAVFTAVEIPVARGEFEAAAERAEREKQPAISPEEARATPEIKGAIRNAGRKNFERAIHITNLLENNLGWQETLRDALARYPVIMPNGSEHNLSKTAALTVIEVESRGKPRSRNRFSSSSGLVGAMVKDDSSMRRYFKLRETEGRAIIPMQTFCRMRQKERREAIRKAMDTPEIAIDYGVWHLARQVTAFNKINPKKPIAPEEPHDIHRIYASFNMGAAGARDGFKAAQVKNLAPNDPLLRHFGRASEKLTRRGKPTDALTELKTRYATWLAAGRIGKGIEALLALKNTKPELYAALVTPEAIPPLVQVASRAQVVISPPPEALAAASPLLLAPKLPKEPHREVPAPPILYEGSRLTTNAEIVKNIEREEKPPEKSPQYRELKAKRPETIVYLRLLPDGTYNAVGVARIDLPGGKRILRKTVSRAITKLSPKLEHFKDSASYYDPKINAWSREAPEKIYWMAEHNWKEPAGVKFHTPRKRVQLSKGESIGLVEVKHAVYDKGKKPKGAMA